MSVRTAAGRRRVLFYAEASAGMYDDTVELVVPQYRLVHQTLVELLRNHLLGIPPKPAPRFRGWVLDIGSGTGTEALHILTEFPGARLVAVDLCEPMHREFARKLENRPDLQRRCRLIRGDIAGKECSVERLLDALNVAKAQGGRYAAVVSAFAIHHLDREEKLEAFRRIYRVLRPGGLFMNADLFSFQSREMAHQSLRFDLSWIQRQFRDPDEEFAHARTVPAARRASLARAWCRHYKRDNLTEPIEPPDAVARRASGTEGQTRMLRRVGFREVAVPFRCWQVGLLWAKR